jgi:hypothetical protein
MKIKTTDTQSHSQSNEPSLSRSFLSTKIGLWTDKKLYWLQNSSEKLLLEESLTISIREQPIHSDICLSNIYITNHSSQARNLKIFVMHYHENHLADQFTFVSPTEKVIYHLANGSVFLVNGHMNGKYMNEYSVQPIWNFETDQFWKNKNKGTLNYQPMYRGPSCSIFSIDILILGSSTAKGNAWIITGDSKNKMIQLNQVLGNKLATLDRKSGNLLVE